MKYGIVLAVVIIIGLWLLGIIADGPAKGSREPSEPPAGRSLGAGHQDAQRSP